MGFKPRLEENTMTKIDVVSGFLGAGKTTLIKKLLKEALDGSKTVLIENEFGEIGIDGGFLKESGIEIKEMNSGCICCSLVGDFGASLKEVISQYHPDLILMDIKMPVMDGFEATRRIRTLSKTIPIIALTAFAFEREKEIAKQCEFTDYVVKPIDIKELKKLIVKVLA